MTDAGLKSRHVFLDTEVYRRYGHNLQDKVLQTLLRQTKDHVCTLHTTDITMSEVERQIAELATELAQLVIKSNRQVRNWRATRSWNSSPKSQQDDVDPRALADEAIRQFKYKMLVEWSPQTHAALAISAKDIFEAYFKGDPPFDKSDSKEFPDAFVVTALDRWCVDNGERMYVITKDKAMLRAVERTKTLLPIPTLDGFLEIVVEAQHPEILRKVQSIFESDEWDEIEESIRDQVGNLGTIYAGELEDGEVVDHSPSEDSPDLIDFKVISVLEGRVQIVAKIKVPISFEVQYLDTNSAWWDSEEKEFVGGDTDTETFQQDVAISALITINERDTVMDVDVLTRDIRLSEPFENYK